jgi:hypothetical protein
VRLGVFDLRGGWILWWRIRGWVVVREVAWRARLRGLRAFILFDWDVLFLVLMPAAEMKRLK